MFKNKKASCWAGPLEGFSYFFVLKQLLASLHNTYSSCKTDYKCSDYYTLMKFFLFHIFISFYYRYFSFMSHMHHFEFPLWNSSYLWFSNCHNDKPSSRLQTFAVSTSIFLYSLWYKLASVSSLLWMFICNHIIHVCCLYLSNLDLGLPNP